MSSADERMVVSVALVAALLLLAAWIAWLAYRLEVRRLEDRRNGRRELLAKAADPTAFRALVESGTAERLLGKDLKDEVGTQAMRAVRRGIVALFLGLGLGTVGAWLDEPAVTASGFLTCITGTGLLVASWVTRRLEPGDATAEEEKSDDGSSEGR